MDTTVEEEADRPIRQWGRTRTTRRTILEAAREVFTEDGYERANIAHIVARSGLSVGSVYHHFSGKSDLFISLWDEYEQGNRAAAEDAVAQARRAGEGSPVELFVIGTRAYLANALLNAKTTLLFSGNEGPAGFDALGQESGARWLENNLRLLRLPDDEPSRLTARILTRAVSEGARAAATLDGDPAVEAVVEKTLEIVRRLAA
ncbi:MAG: TetR/AcrR family transcriptional regulator [Microbacteriaceae bacterium]|nr:TetR/AcrR family transcriptional regulator [Microbacteriaceae bacterium]MCL2794322.1 TetR/AcrR family transcriptional regulator [Microbacteriaceae bacterium]